MDLAKYKHIADCLRPNKNSIPKNILYFDQVDEFNKIYRYCKKNYVRVPSTQSKGICNKIQYRFQQRYMMNVSNEAFELVIICSEGCYRFILKNKPSENNVIKGSRAVRDIYKIAEKHGLKSFLGEIAVYDGVEIKKTIKSPHIEFLLSGYHYGKVIKHCYHLDFNSAYASEIAKEYPQLKGMLEELYNKRHDNDGYYKHVLTNSVGCFQSMYCPDIFSRNYHSNYPYQFANLSKIAINGTRNRIIEYIEKLKKWGATPILSNTDGIWYFSDKGAYHDHDEGTKLGQWKHDAIDVDLLVKSKGAYQYLDKKGVCHSVVRGKTNLDHIVDRADWKFGDILKYDLDVEKWKFDVEKGIIRIWQKGI